MIEEDYIPAAHPANLEPEALIVRENFDDRLAAHRTDIFRAFRLRQTDLAFHSLAAVWGLME